MPGTTATAARGAPRFNVVTKDGDTISSAARGTKTPINAEWDRVRFEDADAAPQLATTPPGRIRQRGRGQHLHRFDEGTDVGKGFVFLDNIDVNAILTGKPGNAGQSRTGTK